MYGVMRLQFEDPKMQEYFEALPSKVRAFFCATLSSRSALREN